MYIIEFKLLRTDFLTPCEGSRLLSVRESFKIEHFLYLKQIYPIQQYSWITKDNMNLRNLSSTKITLVSNTILNPIKGSVVLRILKCSQSILCKF